MAKSLVTDTRRWGSAIGSGRRRRLLTMEKTPALAPIASASVRIAGTATQRDPNSARRARRMSIARPFTNHRSRYAVCLLPLPSALRSASAYGNQDNAEDDAGEDSARGRPTTHDA